VRLSALDRKALRDVWRSRGQLAAIAAVVASGIATFVTMRSVLDSLAIAQDDLYTRQRFADVFSSLERAPERLVRRIEALDGVARVESRVVANVTLRTPEDTPETPRSVDLTGAITGRLISLPDTREPRLNAPRRLYGRWPAPHSTEEVIVNQPFADAHRLAPGAILTAVVNERQAELRVVGVAMSPEYILALSPGSFVPDDAGFGLLWIRRGALAALFDMEGAFNDIALTLTADARAAAVVTELDRLLDPYGGLGAVERKNQQSHWFLQNELKQLQSLGALLPTIFLSVAAFLFAMVLGRMIDQARGEIAVLKAFGYSGLEIAVHFGKVVAVVALIAAVLGLAAGHWMGSGMLDLYRDSFRFPHMEYRLAPRIASIAVGLASGAALLGAWRSLARAMRLPPAEAMRPPAPLRFRPTIVERLGLSRQLPVTVRMIVRSVERRPVRALVSVVGTAAGGALLLAGLAMLDSMDVAIDTQFRAAQREDMTVAFNAPRSIAALGDLERFPGVRRAEPFRAVPARIRSGNRSRLVSIEGCVRGATQRPLLDTEGRVQVEWAPGLSLTESLADVLGVAAGDAVFVEYLEGERRVVTETIAAVYPSFVGLGARMELGALCHSLGEGPSMNGAYLLVDAARQAELDTALTETPLVASVTSKARMLRQFEELTGENMDAMSFFLVFFASVLVIGVIYNNARINLAERSRELASMRVLGYTRAEVSTVLLGELALLTLLALPLALIAGRQLALWTFQSMGTEVFVIDLKIHASSYARAVLVVVLAATAAALVVRRRLDHLDLIEALKARA